MLGLAVAAALLLSRGVSGVEASSALSAANAITLAAAPAYQLEAFRWERTTVAVYYNWDGGSCVFGGNDFSGPTTDIAPAILLENLRASIDEINVQLRGGLTLQLIGPATRAELCSTNGTRAIVVGFGTITSIGQALSYGTVVPGSNSLYTAARVFITTKNPLVCPTAPLYRDLQHTMTHELLHAIGIGHSTIALAVMAPTFVACRTPYTLQPDDIAAINALYIPKLPVATSAPVTAPVGIFVSNVIFTPSGQALAVFSGGSADQIESAARTAGATGVWVQDKTGKFQLLVVGGPAFLHDPFRAAFPNGLVGNAAVTLVR